MSHKPTIDTQSEAPVSREVKKNPWTKPIAFAMGISAMLGVGACSTPASGSEIETSPSTLPATSAPQTPGSTQSPEVTKAPEVGTLPSTEQLPQLTPEQVTQTIQDYIGIAKTPEEYAQRRVDAINMIMSAGCTKDEVDKHLFSNGSDAGTYMAYINSSYVIPFYKGIETPGEKNGDLALEWYKSFFQAPHIRCAAGTTLGSTNPYKATVKAGGVSVISGSADSTKSPFTVAFAITVTDNFKESGVNTLQPNSEKILDQGFSFTTDVVDSTKDGKPQLTSTGTKIDLQYNK